MEGEEKDTLDKLCQAISMSMSVVANLNCEIPANVSVANEARKVATKALQKMGLFLEEDEFQFEDKELD